MVRDAVGADREQLATKADLAELRAAHPRRPRRPRSPVDVAPRLVGIAAAIVAAVKLISGLD